MRQDHQPDQLRGADRSEVPPRPWPLTPGNRTRLVLASAFMLFVELALIRWTSSNNLYLVHLTNFVLLASFLGIGLGFLRARAGRDLLPLAPILLAALVGFVLTVATLMALAQEVARTFALFEPLEAYRLDVLGSLTGIVTFAALSFLRLPPLGWAVVAAIVFAVLLGRRARRWPVAALAVLVLLLGAESVLGSFQWSPYYKIHTQDLRHGLVRIEVNNTPLQTALPVEEIRRS